MQRLRLVIEDDEGKMTVVPLIRDEITIGRKEGNTIRLTERNVSRHHARLRRTQSDDGHGLVLVEDLDSYNGVRLNGERVAQQAAVRPGDLIQIGDYALALRAEAPAGAEEVPSAGVSEEALDSTPTELHTVEQELPASQHARLVAVSSNLAGETFPLGQREILIGRTDENDLVINHRSISRNHAKIIFREDSFTIIDLASSNGMKVNGESFGSTLLVNEDIIELGQVKLRFVGPGHDYVFSRADIDDVVAEGGGGGARIMLFLAVLAMVGGGTFWALRPDPTPPVTAAPAPVAKTAPVEPMAPLPPPESDPVDVEMLMDEGRGNLDKRQWSDASRIFARVLQSEPNHAEAKKLRATANTESENQRKLESFQQDVDEGQWVEAYFALEDFPADSVYHPELERQRETIQKSYADSELQRGKALIDDGQLDGARAVHDSLAEKRFAAEQAKALAAAIKAAEAPKPTVAEVTPPKRAVPDGVNGSAPPPAARPTPPRQPVRKAQISNEDFDALVGSMVKAVVQNRRADAIRLGNEALRHRPNDVTVNRNLCVVHRKGGNADLATALRYCKRAAELTRSPSERISLQRTVDQIERALGP